MSDTRKCDEQGREPEAGAARPHHESIAAPASGSPRGQPRRFSAKRKLQAVQRLLGGESLEAVSRDLGVPVARLSEWRDKTGPSSNVALRTTSLMSLAPRPGTLAAGVPLRSWIQRVGL